MRFSIRFHIFNCIVIAFFGSALAVLARGLPSTNTPSSRQGLSSSSNMSVTGNGDLQYTLKYLIFPLVPSKVAEIQAIIYENCYGGIVQRIESHLRPQFDGVEFWIVNAARQEIANIRELLGENVR